MASSSVHPHVLTVTQGPSFRAPSKWPATPWARVGSYCICRDEKSATTVATASRRPVVPSKVAALATRWATVAFSSAKNAGCSVDDEEMALLDSHAKGHAEEEGTYRYGNGDYAVARSTPLEREQGLGIVSFLKGKNILITGATGFLGKVLVEKILRAAPDIGKIYVLIKAEDNDGARRRMTTEIVNSELFRCHKAVHGRGYHDFITSKLKPVAGNTREVGLGIDPVMADEIISEVDIVVNSAANTTFDERYDVALDINTVGPCRLMGLAKRCKKLKLFLHISTAYVNGKRKGCILEKAVSLGSNMAGEAISLSFMAGSLPVLDVFEELKLAFDSSRRYDVSSQDLKMKDLGLLRSSMYGWQDTYGFTKAMGEMMLDSTRGDIPLIIIRPSIIESTWKEPFPGWIEGSRMMDPIVLQYGKGHLTGFLADPKAVLDVVPADMVVNATLAAMAKHGKCSPPGMHIYHVTSSATNPLVNEELAELFFKHFQSSPYINNRGVLIHVQRFKIFRRMEEFITSLSANLLQKIGAPATTSMGLVEKLSPRQHAMYTRLLEKATYLANIYEPYTFFAGRFFNRNTHNLNKEMSEEERRNFEFDVGAMDWKDYIPNIHLPGLRRHVMKERRKL